MAYGPDEILYVLVLAGSAGVAWNLPIAGAIVGLLAIVVTSYRQTIFAYPHGGGSYTVARENLVVQWFPAARGDHGARRLPAPSVRASRAEAGLLERYRGARLAGDCAGHYFRRPDARADPVVCDRGNELYGAWQIGSTSAEDYVKKGRQFAAVMLLTDPTIELVSCGQWGWTDWDRVVLDGLAQFVRYHSIHIYTGSRDYYTNVLEPHKSDQALRVCESLIERTRLAQKLDHSIGIAYDEWNVWYRTRRTQDLRNAGLEEQYDLADALAVATFLNVFIRHCRSVTLANYAQMVNVIAPIFTRPEGLFLQTVYHPLRLYAEHAQATALDAFVDSPLLEDPSVSAEVRDLGPFQSLDVAATCDVDGREVCISVVNRQRDLAVTTRIDLQGRAFDGPVEVHEVNATDVSATNSFDQPELVGVRSRQLESTGSSVEHTFPAHSLTVIRARLSAAAG